MACTKIAQLIELQSHKGVSIDYIPSFLHKKKKKTIFPPLYNIISYTI